jgi:hypothetical protein
MKLPIIDIASLPDLETLSVIFGSLRDRPVHDDSIIILATFVYETSGRIGGLA